jgi:rhamnogalacturonan endolyase
MRRATTIGWLTGLLSGFAPGVNAFLNATETSTQLIIANDRLYTAVEKKSGAVVSLALDGQNLLGTRSGSTGIGPYLGLYATTLTSKYSRH